MSMSNFLEDKILNHITGLESYTPTGNLYVGLLTSATTDELQGEEVVAGSYERIKATFTMSSEGTILNDIDVVFPIATENWGIINDIAIFDDAVGGNLLFYTALATPAEILQDSQIIFKASKLTITLD